MKGPNDTHSSLPEKNQNAASANPRTPPPEHREGSPDPGEFRRQVIAGLGLSRGGQEDVSYVLARREEEGAQPEALQREAGQLAGLCDEDEDAFADAVEKLREREDDFDWGGSAVRYLERIMARAKVRADGDNDDEDDGEWDEESAWRSSGRTSEDTYERFLAERRQRRGRDRFNTDTGEPYDD